MIVRVGLRVGVTGEGEIERRSMRDLTACPLDGAFAPGGLPAFLDIDR